MSGRSRISVSTWSFAWRAASTYGSVSVVAPLRWPIESTLVRCITKSEYFPVASSESEPSEPYRARCAPRSAAAWRASSSFTVVPFAVVSYAPSAEDETRPSPSNSGSHRFTGLTIHGLAAMPAWTPCAAACLNTESYGNGGTATLPTMPWIAGDAPVSRASQFGTERVGSSETTSKPSHWKGTGGGARRSVAH